MRKKKRVKTLYSNKKTKRIIAKDKIEYNVIKVIVLAKQKKRKAIQSPLVPIVASWMDYFGFSSDIDVIKCRRRADALCGCLRNFFLNSHTRTDSS